MKIVFVSDIHNKFKKINIPDCDVLINAGDSTSRGYEYEVSNFAKWFGKTPARHKISISGNHDFYFQTNPKESRKILEDNGVIYLQDEEVVIDGIKFYGSPWQPWFHDWAFNFSKFDDGSQAKHIWNKVPKDTDVLITHSPPKLIGDRVKNSGSRDPNVGCPYLLKKVLEVKPAFHVFGHIHECYGVHELSSAKEVTFVNASCCTLHYEPTNKPIVFELSLEDERKRKKTQL